MTITIVNRGGFGGADTNPDDSYMTLTAPTTNFGSSASLYCGQSDTKTVDLFRPILYFTLYGTGIPQDAVISAAELWVYVSYVAGGPQYDQYNLRRCTRYDWVETQVTWNVYKTGSNWTAAGGDMDAAVEDALVFGPSAIGWFVFPITNIVQDAQANRSGQVNFIILTTFVTAEVRYFLFSSYEHTTTAYHPQLRVTWTLPNRQPEVF